MGSAVGLGVGFGDGAKFVGLSVGNLDWDTGSNVGSGLGSGVVAMLGTFVGLDIKMLGSSTVTFVGVEVAELSPRV